MSYLRKYALDGTSQLIVIQPIYVFLEVILNGVTIHNSINARILATILTYIGIGAIYSIGRGWSVKYLPLHKRISDTLFSITFNIIYTGVLLGVAGIASGNIQVYETVTAMMYGGLLGIITGPLLGISMDYGRTLWMQQKKRTYTIITLTSILLCVILYVLA